MEHRYRAKNRRCLEEQVFNTRDAFSQAVTSKIGRSAHKNSILDYALQAPLTTHTEYIKELRNAAAHAETHGLAEAEAMRNALLIKRDTSGKTLME